MKAVQKNIGKKETPKAAKKEELLILWSTSYKP
jgi:hypothetical protein